MGFFKDIGKHIVRGAADIMTFGTNELAGNPVGNFYESIVDGSPDDPNAALNAQQMGLARENMEMQREFAKNGIRWRVEDAVAAGLHPLAALGAAGASYSPVSASLFPADTSRRDFVRDTASRFGQDILRAQLSRATDDERKIAAANIKKLNAEADYASAMAAESKWRRIKDSLPPPTPQKFQTYMGPNGPETVYSSDYSQAIMSDPLQMWASSFKRALGGPDTIPFWQSVGTAFKRTLEPLKSLDYRRYYK